MSVALRKSHAAPRTAHCELDDWDFDPRYTAGVCPICGWRPGAGVVAAEPVWLWQLRNSEWDVVVLMVLAFVLLVMGVYVARAAGIHLSLTPR
ncbi:MAG: hypothetical protein ACYDGR_03715 [Candidatus Dormibacteria bacterium]